MARTWKDESNSAHRVGRRAGGCQLKMTSPMPPKENVWPENPGRPVAEQESTTSTSKSTMCGIKSKRKVQMSSSDLIYQYAMYSTTHILACIHQGETNKATHRQSHHIHPIANSIPWSFKTNLALASASYQMNEPPPNHPTVPTSNIIHLQHY